MARSCIVNARRGASKAEMGWRVLTFSRADGAARLELVTEAQPFGLKDVSTSRLSDSIAAIFRKFG